MAEPTWPHLCSNDQARPALPTDPPPPPPVSLSWTYSRVVPPLRPHDADSSASSATGTSTTSEASPVPSPSPFSYSYTSSSSTSSFGSFATMATSPAALLLPKASLDVDVDPDADAAPYPHDSSSTVAHGSSTPVREDSPLPEGSLVPAKPFLEPELLPPENFAMVSSFLYRSSFPSPKNFAFLRTLGLKSVLTLVLEEYPQENREFLEAEGIKFFQVGIPGNKSPIVQIPDDKIVEALAIVFDVRNHPMLIHCNKGKHRTGCLVGCIRKAQQWPADAIAEEYRRFSYPKSRSVDAQYIEAFSRLPEVWDQINHDHLPPWLSRSEQRDVHFACPSPSTSIYSTYAESSAKKKKKPKLLEEERPPAELSAVAPPPPPPLPADGAA